MSHLRSHKKRFSLCASFLPTQAVAVCAKPLRRSSKHVLHERRPVAHHRRWSRATKPHRSSVLPLRIGLAQQTLHRGEEFLNEVAHPDSAQYGQHWSKAKVVETFAPKKESIDLVMEWLGAEGIRADRVRLSAAKNWLSFNATAREVERLLKTEYHVFRHFEHGYSHVACDAYHVPEHLAEHIALIMPTEHFDQRVGHSRQKHNEELAEETQNELKMRYLQKRQRPEHGIVGLPTDQSLAKLGQTITNALMDLTQCDTMITPACLRALYNTPPGSLSSSNNTLGIVEYTPQAILQSDLNLYFSQFQSELQGKGPVIRLLDNGVVQTQNQSFNFNGESALDLEFAMAMIFPQTATLFQVGDLVQGASFNNFLDGIDGSFCSFQGGDSKDPSVDGQYSAQVNCGTARPTNVISTSYSYL